MNTEMQFPPPPDIIFKYFHPDRTGILRDFRIRFADPAQFNDPFEVYPRFDLRAEKVANQALEELVAMNAQFGISARASREYLQNYIKEMLPARVKYHNETFQKMCGEQFRMLCFCECVQSPVMWAHYCDCQRGFALQFDTAHMFFLNRLAPVQYDVMRPEADDSLAGLRIPLTKNLEWKYEKEWRIVQRVNSSAPYFEVLPIECVKAVYFGIRISPLVRREIELALNAPNRAHIQKFAMSLDPAEYKLVPLPFEHRPEKEGWWIGEGI